MTLHRVGEQQQNGGGAQPIRVGEVYPATAVRLNDDGEGVVLLQGLVTFVPGLLPGEGATVRVVSVARHFARAERVSAVEEVTEESIRTQPECAVFEQCGGCRLQHIHYRAQLRHKREVVRAALKRIGSLPELSVADTLGMDFPWRYRNQVQVPLSYDEETKTLLAGFFAAHSHRLIATQTCVLEPLGMETTVAAVTRMLPDLLGREVRFVHHVVVRESYTNERQMVILCLRGTIGHRQQQALRKLSTLPQVVGVAVTIQPRSHGPVWGKTVEMLTGESFLTEDMDDLEMLISPRSFFQTNTLQARMLYRYVRQQAQIVPGQRVLDAYCGIGSIGLYLAAQGAYVVGMESNPAAVVDARRNAAHNGLSNTEFVTAQVERELPRRVVNGERFDLTVLDPPRDGCRKEVLQAVADADSNRVIYVSCNPATLARDLVQLVHTGYRVETVQPVDMFPQTAHVECVVSLMRK